MALAVIFKLAVTSWALYLELGSKDVPVILYLVPATAVALLGGSKMQQSTIFAPSSAC